MAGRSDRNFFGPTASLPAIKSGDYSGLWSDGQIGPNPPGGGGIVRIAIDGNNIPTLFPFYLPVAITVSKFTFSIQTASAGQTANFGIYDILGNKKFDSGPISCAVATTVSGTGASTILTPGQYFFAQSCTDGVAAVTTSIVLGTAISNMLNQNKRRIFIRGANLTVAGVMPSTLGAITGGLSLSPVLGWFE